VGPAAAPLAAGARAALAASGSGGGTQVREVSDADSAEALLTAELAAGDVVLFKSSRDAGLRLLGDRLAATREGLT
jgi:UDP-N-acetylmuramoyl-tripeptide--D-alanyl-D-alanine ligase